MIKPLSQTYALRWACLFFILVLSASSVSAFTKPAAKAPPIVNHAALRAVAANADSVTLVEDVASFTLDTFKDGIVNQFKVSLKFKLKNYNAIHNAMLKVPLHLKPIIALSNLSLYKDDTDTITITKADWGTSTDATVNKSITVSVQQSDPGYRAAGIIVTTDVAAIKGTVVLRFMPYAGKVKAAANANLIAPGNAEIVYLKKIGITHDYLSTINSIDSVTVKVRLHGKYEAKHNQLVFSFLDTTMAKHFQIMENPITITEWQWNNSLVKPKKNPVIRIDTLLTSTTENGVTVKHMQIKSDTSAGDTILPIHLHIKTIAVTDSLNTLQNLFLVIKGQTQADRGTQRIAVSIRDVPFWAEGGTNFALLDNIKSNNFYAGVYMFDKDVARIGKSAQGGDKNNNLSFTGGVYESQSIGNSASTAAGIAFRNDKNLIRDTGVVKAATSVKSIGILFSPHLKLTNGKTDANGLHVFISFYAELLWQTVTSTFDYSKAGKDSALATLPAGKTLANYPYKESSVSYDFRSHYLGFGLPIYIKENEFTLYINTVTGITNQKFYVNNNNFQNDLSDPNMNSNYIRALTFNSPKSNWNGFLLFQYRLNDVAYGITFSGEIRELLLQNAKPVVTLALSKKFNLSKLFASLFSADK